MSRNFTMRKSNDGRRLNPKLADLNDTVLDGLTSTTGDVSFNSVSVSNLPTTGDHLTNKTYVDSIAVGLDPKESCRVGTTANITLSGTQTIDDIAVIAGDRVLVKDQTDAKENGIYVCASGAWARSSDMDGTPTSEVSSGNYTFVEVGTANAGKQYVVLGDGVLTLGVDDINWSQVGSSYTAGTGIDITGTTISLDLPITATNGDVDVQLGDALGSKFFSVQDSGAVDVFRVDSDGNVTTGAVIQQNSGLLTIGNTGNSDYIYLRGGFGSGWYFYNNGNIDCGTSGAYVKCGVNGGYAPSSTGTCDICTTTACTDLRIGRVGANTTLRGDVLSLVDGSGNTFNYDANKWTFGTSNGYIQGSFFRVGRYNDGVYLAESMKVTAASAFGAVSLDSSGNIGINTTSPTTGAVSIGWSSRVTTFGGNPLISLPQGLYAYWTNNTTTGQAGTGEYVNVSLTEGIDKANNWTLNTNAGEWKYAPATSSNNVTRVFQMEICFDISSTGSSGDALIKIQQDQATGTWTDIPGAQTQRYMSGSNDHGAGCLTCAFETIDDTSFRLYISGTATTYYIENCKIIVSQLL